MKSLKIFMAVLFSFAIVIACGIGIAADNTAAPAAASDDVGKTDKKGPPKGDILYKQDFEEEDDTDTFSSDGCEVEWQKGGANGSKGCLKVFGGTDGVGAEKYIQWYDAKTYIDFDYFLNGYGTDDLYVLAWGAKANQNVRVHVKSFLLGKWAHAQCKAADMNQVGKSGKGDTFKNIVFCANGADKECKDPYMLIDNIVITATAKKKEDAE